MDVDVDVGPVILKKPLFRERKRVEEKTKSRGMNLARPEMPENGSSDLESRGNYRSQSW
jgi:hypothetical protein